MQLSVSIYILTFMSAQEIFLLLTTNDDRFSSLNFSHLFNGFKAITLK